MRERDNKVGQKGDGRGRQGKVNHKARKEEKKDKADLNTKEQRGQRASNSNIKLKNEVEEKVNTNKFQLQHKGDMRPGEIMA